ncbi:MAG TPA: type II toxin-antitoxin system VapC family toxin, partial [Arcobacter sp.]|nr:type II toxin-antitoxin system VapC family toxin [Arcobacter sp.]
YLLDTNIVSYIVKNQNYKLIDKLEEESKSHTLGVSTITVAELYHGIIKKGSEKLAYKVTNVLLPLTKYDFDESAAFEYGKIKSDIEKSGKIIGSNDMLIASHAKALKATLVTNNIKEFERIPELQVENWI